MTISANMNSGLSYLLDINSEMSSVQGRLSTGKRDLGVVQLLTVTDFKNRASTLGTVNDNIITALAQFKASTTAITSIRTSMSDTLNALRDARTTAAKTVSGSSRTNDPSRAGAAFTLNMAAKTAGTLISGASAITDIAFNGQSLRIGDKLALTVESSAINTALADKTINIKIVGSETAAALGSAASIDAATRALGDATTEGSATKNKADAQTAYENALAAKTASDGVTNAMTIANNATGLGAGADAGLLKAAVAYYTGNTGVNKGAPAAGTTITVTQFVQFMHAVATGAIDFVNNADNSNLARNGANSSLAQLATIATGNVGDLKDRALGQLNGTGTIGALENYAGGLSNIPGGAPAGSTKASVLATAKATYVTFLTAKATKATADQAFTVAQNAYNAQIAARQTGEVGREYLVYNVSQYLAAFNNLNTGDNQNRVSMTIPTLTTPSRSFDISVQTNGNFAVSVGGQLDPTSIQALFAQNAGTSAPADQTNPYDVGVWSSFGTNGYKLQQTHYTGTGAGTTTAAADAKRKVAANTVRNFFDQMKQLIKDSRVNGVNILNGEQVSVSLNSDGDKFTFGLQNQLGQPQSLLDSLAINLADFGLIQGGTKTDGTESVNNDFDNNVDMDAAITKFTSALAQVDISKSNITNGQSTLQSRSEFNTALIKIFNEAAINLETVDSTAEAATLASLQNRQQFANSILGIIKQGEQNPLVLLR